MTTREPLFTEQDRAELMALDIYRDRLCPRCGRPLEVCTSDEESGPEFLVRESTCRATLAIAERKNALTDNGKKSIPYAESRLFGTTIRKR